MYLQSIYLTKPYQQFQRMYIGDIDQQLILGKEKLGQLFILCFRGGIDKRFRASPQIIPRHQPPRRLKLTIID